MRLAWKLLARDWRAGELTVLAAALLVAVAAMTGVAFLTDRVGQAVEMRAAESLAADLRLDSTRPISDDYAALAAANGLRSAHLSSMPSVVFAGEANTLAAVRAVTAGYPLRGRLKTSERLLGEVQVTDAIPAPGRGLGRAPAAGATGRRHRAPKSRWARRRCGSPACWISGRTRAGASSIWPRRC